MFTCPDCEKPLMVSSEYTSAIRTVGGLFILSASFYSAFRGWLFILIVPFMSLFVYELLVNAVVKRIVPPTIEPHVSGDYTTLFPRP
jgi:hypothetical protein